MLRETDNVQGQISEHIFTLKWRRLFAFIIRQMFLATFYVQDRLKIGKYHSYIAQLLTGTYLVT